MFEEIGTTTEGDLIINVGPQHPATHGVLHLVITLNGETIKKVEPHLGFIHRSIEKMCESLTYRQFIYVTSRMDYLSSHINNQACALCFENWDAIPASRHPVPYNSSLTWRHRFLP